MDTNAQNSLDLSNVGRQAPPAPSKYDIIPIHTSDRGTFKDCRRRWDWSSPARLNLTRKVRIYGITWPLFFGTAIHYALEQYYNPLLNEDPVVEFDAFMDLHWKGGIVSEEDLEKYGLTDREPKLLENGSYNVEGLIDLLPDADPGEWEEYVNLGRGMLNFYKTYAEKNDNFTTIAVEHNFSVPILNPSTGEPLYMVDTRTMPEGWVPNFDTGNGYGPLNKWIGKGGKSAYIMKQVHARGKIDKVIQDNRTGMFGLHDYKTVGRAWDDDDFKFLELDEQVTTYMFAGEREAEMYDLEYKSLDFIIYESIRKGYPKPPTINKDGITPSIARSTETTTAEMFAQYIDESGLRVVYESDVKMQAYYTFLLEEGDKRFVERKPVYRNAAQKRNCGNRIYLEAMDMLSPNVRIYPNPSKNWNCLNCAFRGPCVMAEQGADFISILSDSYHGNYDR